MRFALCPNFLPAVVIKLKLVCSIDCLVDWLELDRVRIVAFSVKLLLFWLSWTEVQACGSHTLLT